MSVRTLHQFPISHFCEKTRWHLDRKGLAYEVRNLIPGLHGFVNRRVAGRRTVPVLIDGSHAVGDSTEIALYLEDAYPDRPLLPGDPAERARALELEAFFDEGLGPAIRRYLYGEALRTPRLVRRIFFRDYDLGARLVGGFVGGVLEDQIRRMYRIDEAGITESWRRIEEAADRIEATVRGRPDRYLVGNELSLADLTAASLMAPLVGPPWSAWEQLEEPSDAVLANRGEMRARLAGKWVLRVYARDRRAAP